MKIVIAGGTGFIGRKLSAQLIREGHEVVILTRKRQSSKKGAAHVLWLHDGAAPEKELGQVDAIVNLAGVSINDGRWTKKHQASIYASRMEATDELLRIVDSLREKPSVWINASAIGIYPVSLDRVYTETAAVTPNDFLGRTVAHWEEKAKQVERYGVRTAMMRFGVVLGKEGGALPLMTLPYRLFAGGKVGSGKQWVSWVHVTDVIRAITFAMQHESLSGPVNVTAPEPMRMNDFGKTIGNILKRPHWFPAPALALKLALGKKSKLVLEGQNVLPNVLLEAGFTFSFPTLELALQDLYE